MENLPNEVVLQILSYLNIGELIQCARVSKRLNTICEDKSLSYRSNMLQMKDLTVKNQNSIIDVLIANPELTEVKISPKTLEWGLKRGILEEIWKSLVLFYGKGGVLMSTNAYLNNKDLMTYLKINRE